MNKGTEIIVNIRKLKKNDDFTKRDAVVIHGMLSNGNKLKHFCSSIHNRKIYNEVFYITNKDLSHRFIPKLNQKSTTKNYIIPRIETWLEKNRIRIPFDVIGHSNGGYAAIHLANLLPKGTISNVFTIATPTGFSKIDVEWENIKNIYHIGSGQDGIVDLLKKIPNSDEESRPSISPFLFIFPNEYHSSVHQDANTNGLADLIQYLNNPKGGRVFIDRNNILHPWDWCRDEFDGKIYEDVNEIKSTKFTICPGIHNAILPEPPKDLTSIIFDFKELRRIHKFTNETLKETKKEITELKFANNYLNEELKILREENNRLQNAEELLQKKFDKISNKLLTFIKEKKTKILSDLDVAEIISNKRNFSRSEYQILIKYMQNALSAHKEINDEVNNKKLLKK